MFVIVWRYRAKPEHSAEFERAYGGDGPWAKMFAKADGYLGTEFLLSKEQPGTYITLDRWESRDNFERFKQLFGDEYFALDEVCEAYTESEEFIGYFER